MSGDASKENRVESWGIRNRGKKAQIQENEASTEYVQNDEDGYDDERRSYAQSHSMYKLE